MNYIDVLILVGFGTGAMFGYSIGFFVARSIRIKESA